MFMVDPALTPWSLWLAPALTQSLQEDYAVEGEWINTSKYKVLHLYTLFPSHVQEHAFLAMLITHCHIFSHQNEKAITAPSTGVTHITVSVNIIQTEGARRGDKPQKIYIFPYFWSQNVKDDYIEKGHPVSSLKYDYHDRHYDCLDGELPQR